MGSGYWRHLPGQSSRTHGTTVTARRAAEFASGLASLVQVQFSQISEAFIPIIEAQFSLP